MRRFAAILISLALLAAAGCGGGGDSTTDSQAGESPDLGVESTQGGEKTQPGQGRSAEGGGGSTGTEAGASKPNGLPPSDSSSLPNEGSEAVAPGVPTVSNGDNSIQTYGVESSGDERAEAATVVKAYLDAQQAAVWAKACSLLAAPIAANLIELWEKAKGADAGGCPRAMAAAFARLPEGPLRTIADLHVLSLRVQGNRGFLIYEDGAGTASETPMQHEADGWRIRAIIPKELILSRG